MKFVLSFLLFSSVASYAQHSTGLVFDNQADKTKKKYTIQLGPFGISGATQAETIIYKVKSGFVALFDGNDSKKMGMPFATHLEFDTTDTGCMDLDAKPFKGKVYKSKLLPSKLSMAPDSVFSETPLAVEFPSGACPTSKIRVRVLGPTCLGPDPACQILKVYKTYKVNPGAMHFLDAIEDEKHLEKLPGLKGSEE